MPEQEDDVTELEFPMLSIKIHLSGIQYAALKEHAEKKGFDNIEALMHSVADTLIYTYKDIPEEFRRYPAVPGNVAIWKKHS